MVLSSGHALDEKISSDQLLTNVGSFGKEKTSYSITSAGYSTGAPTSSIMINGQEYSHNTRGINIVVYDNTCRAMIDSVTFDTCADRKSQRSWFIDMQRNGINWNYNSSW